MRIEVCYADARGATRIEVDVEEGASVSSAIEASAIATRLSLDLSDLAYAVFGRRAAADTALAEGDRVELLRPLSVDPKEARRRRAAKKASIAGNRR